MALRIARDEYPTLAEAFGFAWRVKLTGTLYPVAVGIPLAGLAFLIAIANLVGSIPYAGWLFGIVLLIPSLLAALVIIVGGVIGLAALGLVPAAIATERKGTYDTFGRAATYVIGRPVPLILYGVLVGIFVVLLKTALIDMSLAETLIGRFFFSDSRYEEIVTGVTSESGFLPKTAAYCHARVFDVYRLFVWGTLVSYVLGASTAAYLIFRNDMEGIPYGEIASDAPPKPAPAPAPAKTGTTEA
jgi:hypothetical protein